MCEKMMPGFGELMRSASLKFVPTAILSRQTAGVRGRTLIVNLPGRVMESTRFACAGTVRMATNTRIAGTGQVDFAEWFFAAAHKSRPERHSRREHLDRYCGIDAHCKSLDAEAEVPAAQ